MNEYQQFHSVAFPNKNIEEEDIQIDFKENNIKAVSYILYMI